MNTYNGFSSPFSQQPQMNNLPGKKENPTVPKNITAPKPKFRPPHVGPRHNDIESPDNVKKQIVIFKLTEPVGNVNSEAVDSQFVQHMLSAIVGQPLNIKLIKRLGKFIPGQPRRTLVQFNTINEQQLVINNADKLINFQGWKHLDIQAYRPLKKRLENEKRQGGKGSKNAAEIGSMSYVDESILQSNPFITFASEENSIKQKQVNILVIGATGVGKSTWINGIANYMSFNTFDDAINAKQPICLIPMTFKLFGDELTNTFMPATIGEKDANEAEASTGQSCTQEPKVYQYITDTVAFNLIDTPGICDTRGVEADIKNIKSIMECMSQWEEIHGICLLLKPDQHRLILPFRYCIQELLINLHKNSIPNIAVVFTNTCSTFYRPGGTMNVLNELFEAIKNETGCFIPLEDENTFCIDNEAVKILYAKHKRVKVDKSIIENVEHSWNHTVKETFRLFKYFSEMAPHLTYETKVTTQIRETLNDSLKIMAETNDEIVQTQIVLNEQNKHLKVLQANIKNRRNVVFQGEYIENTPSAYPITVCCGQNCFETVKSLNSETPDKLFKRICCTQCPLKTVTPEHMGHVNLRQCEAFGNNGNCKICGCSWQLHMHFWYSQKKVTGNFLSSTNQDSIDLLNIQVQMKSYKIGKLQDDIKSFEQSYQKVKELCLPCFKFLTQNSIITVNNAYEEYLNLSIKEFEKSSKVGADQTKLDRLQKLLAVQEQQKSVNVAFKDPKTKFIKKFYEEITLLNYIEHISRHSQLPGSKLGQAASIFHGKLQPLSHKTVTCVTKIKQNDGKITKRNPPKFQPNLKF